MDFNKMCRGWALGSKDVKRELLQSKGLLKDGAFERLRIEGKALAEANELIWENSLKKGMRAAGRTDVDAANDWKSADWKVWIAAELKRHTSSPSTWIAQKLNMGSPQLVGVYVNRLVRDLEQEPNQKHQDIIAIYGMTP